MFVNRRLPLWVLLVCAGCGPAPAGPTTSSSGAQLSGPSLVDFEWLTEGSRRLHIARIALADPADARFDVPAGPCQEVYLVPLRESIHLAGEDVEVGGAARVSETVTVTTEFGAVVLVGFARAAAFEISPAGTEVPPSCESPSSATTRIVAVGDNQVVSDALEVEIFFDAPSASQFSALSILRGGPGTVVPEHTHESSDEILFILQGQGAMRLGDGQQTVSPGRLIHIPENVVHDFQGEQTPLVALQFYTPPGPEQRFRALAQSRVETQSGEAQSGVETQSQEQAAPPE